MLISDPSNLKEANRLAYVEIERLRALFKKVQDHCAGDAHPRWGREAATTNSRGYLLDLCNNALN